MSRLLARALPLVVTLFFAARGLTAQTLAMGNLPPGPYFGFNPGPVTAVDLASPANASGTVTSAAFSYSVTPCPATVKIKFFRPSGGTLNFLAERGPFNVTTLTQTVSLAPGVAVQVGDLVGIARVLDCGSPVGQVSGAAAGFVAFGTDVTTSVSIASGSRFTNMTLSVQATGVSSASTVGIGAAIPVVISAPGVPPSFFRTSIQLTNPGTGAISGTLVFHRAEVSGSASDPSLSYALGPGQTQTIADFLPALGLSGIGSVDVVVVTGGLPVAVVRVYNDAGSAGTTGFTEEPARSADFLVSGDRAVLIAPSDPTLFRWNIGVRSMGSGTTLTLTVRDANGVTRRTLTKSYPPDNFVQTEASAFLGISLGSSDTVTVDVTSGSAVVYAVAADNRTQDSSIQIGRRSQ